MSNEGGELIPFRPSTKLRSHVDWEAAFEFYASDLTRTYKDVGKQFKLNFKNVQLHGAKHGWVQRRRELRDQAAAQAELRIVRTLVERQQETIRVADRLRETALDLSQEISAKDAIMALPAYVKLERLFEGASTDNTQTIPFLDLSVYTDEELEVLLALVEKGRHRAA